MDTSTELHQIRMINKAMTWVLLLLLTSNLDHISTDSTEGFRYY